MSYMVNNSIQTNTWIKIKTSKNNGKTITRDGIVYEYVGDDFLFNTKTNKIEKL